MAVKRTSHSRAGLESKISKEEFGGFEGSLRSNVWSVPYHLFEPSSTAGGLEALSPADTLKKWDPWLARLKATGVDDLVMDSGLPKALVVAQTGLESALGTRGIGQDKNNVMGMKYKQRHPAKVLAWTWEMFTRKEFDRWLAGMRQSHPKLKWLPAPPTGSQADSRQWCDKQGFIAWASGPLSDTRKTRVDLKDWFASFPTLRAALDDYAWLLTQSSMYRPHFARYLEKWSQYVDQVTAPGVDPNESKFQGIPLQLAQQLAFDAGKTYSSEEKYGQLLGRLVEEVWPLC
jgi:hypothetical protein